MSPARGESIGIEVGADVLRGVRLDLVTPGRLAASEERAVNDLADDAELLEAFASLHARLGAGDEPTRIAWFGSGSTLQRTELGTDDATAIARRRGELQREFGAATTAIVESAGRRWLLAIAWDEPFVGRLERLARHAGFADVRVEPSPLAVSRILDRRTGVIRRRTDAATEWGAVCDGSSLVLAASSSTAVDPCPSFDAAACDPSTLLVPDRLVAHDELEHEVDAAVAAGFTRGDEMGDAVGLHLRGDPYPAFPIDDQRSPARVAIALGAAAGAAGLVGREPRLERGAVLDETVEQVRRPWAIEWLGNEDPESVAESAPWWRRWWRRLVR